MLFLKYLLLIACFGLFVSAAGAILYDIYLAFELNRILSRRKNPSDSGPSGDAPPPGVVLPRPRRAIRWNTAAKLLAIAALARRLAGRPSRYGALPNRSVPLGVHPGKLAAARG